MTGKPQSKYCHNRILQNEKEFNWGSPDFMKHLVENYDKGSFCIHQIIQTSQIFSRKLHALSSCFLLMWKKKIKHNNVQNHTIKLYHCIKNWNNSKSKYHYHPSLCSTVVIHCAKHLAQEILLIKCIISNNYGTLFLNVQIRILPKSKSLWENETRWYT